MVQLVLAIKVVHLEPKNSTSLGAPTTPFKAIELIDALREDAQLWHVTIKAEYSSFKEAGTTTIIRGRLPLGRNLISSR